MCQSVLIHSGRWSYSTPTLPGRSGKSGRGAFAQNFASYMMNKICGVFFSSFFSFVVLVAAAVIRLLFFVGFWGVEWRVGWGGVGCCLFCLCFLCFFSFFLSSDSFCSSRYVFACLRGGQKRSQEKSPQRHITFTNGCRVGGRDKL